MVPWRLPATPREAYRKPPWLSGADSASGLRKGRTGRPILRRQSPPCQSCPALFPLFFRCMLSWELQMPFYLLLSGRVLPFFTAKPVVAVPVALTGFKVFEFFITAFEFLSPPAGVFTLRFACLLGFRQDIHFTTTGRLFLDSLIVHFPSSLFS